LTGLKLVGFELASLDAGRPASAVKARKRGA
jgi:hypothetical protein